MKRVLLIAVMIMAGVLMYGEIEYDSGFNYRTKEGTHNYTVVKQKYFDKPLTGEYKLSQSTETSAGDLLFERHSIRISTNPNYPEFRQTLTSFDSNINRVELGTHFSWRWSDFGKYLTYKDFLGDTKPRKYTEDTILMRSGNSYKVINYIKPKQKYWKLMDTGYFLVSDDFMDDYGIFWEGVQKIGSDEATIINVRKDICKPGDDIDYQIEYVDDHKIVYSFYMYSYKKDSGGGPFNGNGGFIFYDHSGNVLKMIEVPFEIFGGVSPDPTGSVFSISGKADRGSDDSGSALVYEDGRIVTNESIGCSLSPNYWSPDGSLMTTDCGDLIDVVSGIKLMSVKSAAPPSNASAGRIVITSKHMIKVFDIKTKELIVSFPRGGGVIGYNLRISGDGTEVLAVTDMKYTKIKIGERKK